ncbi:MAG TPA: exodeoxyribonuclease III [Anaerolineaceae bacterium]|nr:exodeoxyribonuclease III [Anaerolineaceae bacterium]
MKITTWNVNGYRAVLNKGFGEWVQSYQPDVLCLQEIKVAPSQLDPSAREIPGYFSIWNPAQRPGYSGVATFVRIPDIQNQIGLGAPRFDVEGRVLRTTHDGFHLLNVYFPSGQRGLDRVGYKLEFYAALLDWCDRMHAAGEKLVVTGDFNTAHREIDLAHPRQNIHTSGFLPEERAWIDTYLEHGFVDAFRWLYPDRVAYTWWTYVSGARSRNIGWRLDYFMVSKGLLDRVTDVTIHTEVLGSDHCPVTLNLKDA